MSVRRSKIDHIKLLILVFSIAYIRGQFFHTKYVVIFGLYRLFAYIDGMTPPGAAICISRITKYELFWNIKLHFFLDIPVCGVTLTEASTISLKLNFIFRFKKSVQMLISDDL